MPGNQLYQASKVAVKVVHYFVFHLAHLIKFFSTEESISVCVELPESHLHFVQGLWKKKFQMLLFIVSAPFKSKNTLAQTFHPVHEKKFLIKTTSTFVQAYLLP